MAWTKPSRAPVVVRSRPSYKKKMTVGALATLGKFAISYKRPTVAAKVQTLTRQVQKLNKVSYDQVTLRMGTVSTGMSAPVYQYAVCSGINTWPPTFGSDAADIANASKMYVNSYQLDVRVEQGSENSLITYTAYLVSLKDQANDSSTFDPLNGRLNLVEGTHYAIVDSNGRAIMNKKFFNVHSTKRFFMGGTDATAQGAIASRNLSFTVKPKNKLIENPRGNIFGTNSTAGFLTYPRDPSQNYFFLLFNDNSLLDLESNTIKIGGLAHVAIPS